MALEPVTGCGGFWKWLTSRRATPSPAPQPAAQQTPQHVVSTKDKVMHQWFLLEETIYLIRKGDNLLYKVANRAQEKVGQGTVPSDKRLSTDKHIEALVHAHPIYDAGVLRFVQKPSCCEWSWDDKTISLLNISGTLVWELCDKGSKTTSHAAFGNAKLHNPTHGVVDPRVLNSYGYFWSRFHMEEVDEVLKSLMPALREGVRRSDFLISQSERSHLLCNLATVLEVVESGERRKFELDYQEFTPVDHAFGKKDCGCSIAYVLGRKNVDFRVDFLRDCVLDDVTVVDHRLTSLILKPVYFISSQIDKSKLIDKYMWAITLINSADDWCGHAQLAIERLNEKGEYQMLVAHLTGEKTFLSSKIGTVKVTEIAPETLSYTQRGETWLVIKERAEEMMEHIKNEISKEMRGGVGVYFNIRGPDAALVPTKKYGTEVHNCMTWARAKLAIAGVQLEKGERLQLFVTPKEYMGRFPGELPRYSSITFTGLAPIFKDLGMDSEAIVSVALSREDIPSDQSPNAIAKKKKEAWDAYKALPF